jgi:transketolase
LKDAGVVSMFSIKPIDKDTIIAAVNETGGIVTIEEHNIDGGGAR